MSLGSRLTTGTPRLVSLLHVLRHVPGALRKRASVEPRDYAGDAVEMADRVYLGDPAIAFYLHCLLEGAYDGFIEVGSYDGARIATVRRHLPGIAATGVDICANYRTPFERFGVAFRPFVVDDLPESTGRTLVASRGTLTYLDPATLDRFLAHVAERGHDIAIVEPMPTFRIGRTIRRGGGASYHPWPELLDRHGFTGMPGQADGCRFHDYLPMMESWYFGLARNGRPPARGGA